MGGIVTCCTSRENIISGKTGFISIDALKAKLENKISPVNVIDCRRGKDAALVE
jgi:hypothetical protein